MTWPVLIELHAFCLFLLVICFWLLFVRRKKLILQVCFDFDFCVYLNFFAGHSVVKRSCQEAEDGAKPYKRIRLMSGDSEDSQATLPLSQSSSQHGNDSQRTEGYSLSDTQRTESYTLSQSEEVSIEFLQGAFPDLPRTVRYSDYLFKKKLRRSGKEGIKTK